MCGIAGFAGQDHERIERMTAALSHRGPDGRACILTDDASLGHARLAILDPRPEGNQPMWNDAKTAAIIFNGEIYNYRDLREAEGFACRTGTDTEVLLRLYERHGMAFIPRLRGMFALGIYDTATRTWHLTRDSGGIKPLFVAYPGGKLHFASEMRSLLSAFPVRPALDLTSLSLYLRLQYVPGPRTMCEGIESLPPGTILSWHEGKETRQSFRPQESVSFPTPEAFREGFPTLMDRVVRSHLVSDKPVGLFLSGGMDSSIVLHHMAKHASEPVRTFTVRFDATEAEGAKRFNTDADLAALSARHYGTKHTELLLTAELYRDWYRATARALDQPNADSVGVAQFLLSREAKKTVDVVLTGAGGDELFGGYPRYRVARILRLLRTMPPPLRAATAALTGHPADVLRLSPGPKLAERLLARPVLECRSIARGEWFEPEATNQLFAERFARLAGYDPVRAFMEFDRTLWLIDESLRLADATTMGNGLEGRVPFVDPRPLAASLSTDARWHVTRGRTKALLKRTYRGLLPDHLYTLEKASFYPPVAKWIRREAGPLVEEMLVHPGIARYFEQKALRRLYNAHCGGGYHLHPLSSLIQLMCWFDEVYEARSEP